MEAKATAELLGPLNAIEQKFAPPQLWTQGDATLLAAHARVAVIGTRRPTSDGQRRARRLVKELVKAGAVIVSGLAEGIDTVAHTQAMDVGGRTIAVLGTPIDQVFPRTNARLQETIGRRDLLVSEFAPASKVAKGNFVRRNRTMALLAHASVIIEAGATSGTISQGWETLRLGRPLFLLKSLVDSPLTWPREMIQYGASVLEDFETLRSALPNGDLRESVAF